MRALFLMKDDASVHRGAVLSRALRSPVSRRLHVACQPAFMPIAKPVELFLENSKLD
jgi:hypothetical protein